MKINKRILLVSDWSDDTCYSNKDLIDGFDEMIDINNYLKPLDVYNQVYANKGRLPTTIYDDKITPSSKPCLDIVTVNKNKYVHYKELDLGDNNLYFCIGDLTWYYLRDVHSSHVGLRNTNKNWQIVHLLPFSMGTNKFVFSHSLQSPEYKRNSEAFWNTSSIIKTVEPLKNQKILSKIEDITQALTWCLNQPKGVLFGMDYETNGLWRGDKYEDLSAIGVGISTKEYGFYIELRDLNSKELNIFKNLYKKVLDKHEKWIWVFNIDFELLVTRKLLGSWKTYEFKDADVWRILYGDQVGYSLKKVNRKFNGKTYERVEKVNRDQRWSLKYTAQKYLKVPSWDNEFEELERKLNIIFRGYKLTSIEGILTNSLISKNIHSLVAKGFLTQSLMTRVLKKLIHPKNILTEKDIEGAFLSVKKGDIPYDKKAFNTVFLGVTDPKEVYSHPVWKEIESQYKKYIPEFKKYIEDKRFSGNPYAVQPSQIMGEYCILDSYYTVMIAETLFEKDDFTYKEGKEVGAEWATTEKLVDIFNSNKSLGGLLNMYGLYKSNTKRDHYNKIQKKIRIYSNFILAKGYHNLILNRVDAKPHPNEKSLNTISISCIARGLNPTDFNRVTKTLFQEIYDDTKKYKWNDTVAENLLGKYLAGTFKGILLDRYSKGFINEKAYNRSTNLHKECGAYIQEEWESLNLPKNFKWDLCKEYYTKLDNILEGKHLLKELDTFNIKGLSFTEFMKLDTVTYKDREGNLVSMDLDMAIDVLKKKFFDVATSTEVSLGQWFEYWKPYRVLLAMYDPEKHKTLIDEAGMFDVSDPVEVKCRKFYEYIEKSKEKHTTVKFTLWQEARRFAKANNFPDHLCNPTRKDVETPLQQEAYIDKVTSEDLYRNTKLSTKFNKDLEFYESINKEEMKEDKEALLKYSDISPLSYRDSALSSGRMCSLHNNMVSGNPDSGETEKLLKTCDISEEIGFHYYPLLTTFFKLYRKYDKLGQYLNGQLVDSDCRLISEDEDGVPLIGPLTSEEKHTGFYGDNVKMFPRYEIMQKITKRNSSGIHTVPSSSEVKGVIVAPDDKLLVYTDISSMELRGIAAISKDPVMLDYFEQGHDIYTSAAMAYHVDYLKKPMSYEEIRKEYRGSYKVGVISTIYTASDKTLSRSYGVEVFEVGEIKEAIFKKFKRLYEWQTEQVKFNKSSRGNIKTFLGDIRKTYDRPAKQSRQAVNMDVQGTCSLVATAGFGNIITAARKKKMYLAPAVIVHDAIVAYAMAKDIEKLYDHYQEAFYDFLDKNYGFRFPFDLEVAANYFEKTVLEKGKNPREFSISGTNRAIFQVLSRSVKHGKKIEFNDLNVNLESINKSIDDNYSELDQYLMTKGNPSFNRDFSKAKYFFKFTD
jgi:hypothetical protein